MPFANILRIQLVNGMNIPTLVRAANDALQSLINTVNDNFRLGYPQIDTNINANATHLVWIPLEDAAVVRIAVKTSAGTASVTPRINGVAMGVVGGVPITATTTATEYQIESANLVEKLDYVDLVVAGLGAGANIIASIDVRRT